MFYTEKEQKVIDRMNDEYVATAKMISELVGFLYPNVEFQFSFLPECDKKINISYADGIKNPKKTKWFKLAMKMWGYAERDIAMRIKENTDLIVTYNGEIK